MTRTSPPIAILLTCCFLFDLMAAAAWLITTFHGKLGDTDGSLMCSGLYCCQPLSSLPEPGDKGVTGKISYSSGIFFQRTILVKLLPNTCNWFIKKMKLFGGYNVKMGFLSISFLVFDSWGFCWSRRSFVISGSTVWILLPSSLLGWIPTFLWVMTPLMISWSNSKTFQPLLVTRKSYSKIRQYFCLKFL